MIRIRRMCSNFLAAALVIICVAAVPQQHKRHSLTLLAVQEGSGSLQIIPVDDPRRARSVFLGLQPHEIELSRNARLAYVSNFGLLEANHKIGTPGNSISVVDLATAREAKKFMLPAGYLAPHGLKLRPSSYQELFVNTEEGQQALVVFDVATGRVLRKLAIPPAVHNFVFDASGARLYAFAVDGNVYEIDPNNGAVLSRTKVNSPRGLTWTSDGNYLIVSGKGELVLLNPDKLAITRQIPVQADQLFYPKALNDGVTILAGAPLDRVLLVVNLKTGSLERRINTRGSPLQICLDPDGLRAWIGNVPLIGNSSVEERANAVGITELDLRTYSTRTIDGFLDINGMAVADLSQ